MKVGIDAIEISRFTEMENLGRLCPKGFYSTRAGLLCDEKECLRKYGGILCRQGGFL